MIPHLAFFFGEIVSYSLADFFLDFLTKLTLNPAAQFFRHRIPLLCAV
jgi:hypothetical protein